MKAFAAAALDRPGADPLVRPGRGRGCAGGVEVGVVEAHAVFDDGGRVDGGDDDRPGTLPVGQGDHCGVREGAVLIPETAYG